jgi:hypothetical protein
MDKINDVSIVIEEKEISPSQDVHGKVKVNYTGRFDTLVINSQIENSNDIFNYTTLNGKKLNYPYARLSIFKEELDNKSMLDFSAATTHVPSAEFSNAKFRVSIIQEHKEVVSDTGFIKIKRSS